MSVMTVAHVPVRDSSDRPPTARLQLLVSALPFALGTAAFLAPGPALGAEVPALFGAVGVGVATPEVRGELQAMLRAELASLVFRRVKLRERYVLSATLLRLDSTFSSDSVRATCVVSVALLRDRGAALYAVIRGQATAEDERAHAGAAESAALRAALHSALTRVPEALR